MSAVDPFLTVANDGFQVLNCFVIASSRGLGHDADLRVPTIRLEYLKTANARPPNIFC
jgi:hypothetical protein